MKSNRPRFGKKLPAGLARNIHRTSPMQTARSLASLRQAVLMLVLVTIGAYGLAAAWNLWSDYEVVMADAQADAANRANALARQAAVLFRDAEPSADALAESMPL